MNQWNSTIRVSKSRLKRSAIKPGKRKPGKPKTERQKLIERLDDIFRDIIRKRAGGFSEKSHLSAPHGQVAHWISRSNLRVRWDEDNAFFLGPGEHHWWAHKYPEKWRTWVREHIGEERFENLLLKSRARGTFTTSRLKMMAIYLEQQLSQQSPPE